MTACCWTWRRDFRPRRPLCWASGWVWVTPRWTTSSTTRPSRPLSSRALRWAQSRLTEFRWDQEKGGELDSHEELDYYRLRVQARSRGGRRCWTLRRAQETSRGGRWSLGSESWTTRCFSCSSTAVLRTLSLSLLRTAVETAISGVH